MNKKANTGTLIVLAVGFVLLLALNFVDPKLTGMVPIDKSDSKIDQAVLNDIEENGMADVIIKLKETDFGEIKAQGSKEDKEAFLEARRQTVKATQDNVLKTINHVKKGEVANNTEEQGNITSIFSADELDFELEYQFSLVSGISGKLTKKGLDKLKNNPDVEMIEKNGPVQAFLQSTINITNATSVHNIQVNGVNIKGKGQTVCILDTGIDYYHNSLGGCTNASFIAGTCSKVIGGYNVINNSNPPWDDHGHGTHVAGIVAANGSITGIAPEAKLIAIKVLNASGSGNDAGIIEGINWCVNNASIFNITVITMSLGGSINYTSYCDASRSAVASAVNLAIAAGIFVDAASGNSGNSTGISAPACIANITSVGSVDKTDVISPTSNVANFLDILAPGVSINSTYPGNNFVSISGTSMAAPHVAGAAALIYQYEKEINGRNATPKEVRKILKRSNTIVYVSRANLSFPRLNVLDSINSILQINETSKTIKDRIGNAQIIFDSSFGLGNSSEAFTIRNNFIGVDTANYTEFAGKAANLTLFNLTFEKTPVIYKNGSICISGCNVLSYDGENLTFSVTGFSNYTSTANSNLSIYDDGDLGPTKLMYENSSFYANYSNKTSGVPISTGACNVSFSDGINASMVYSSGQFKYTRTFNIDGLYSFSVICSDSSYETANTTDNFNISPSGNRPGEWSMFHYDWARTGYTANTATPNISNALIYSAGSDVYSSPAVVGGYVYIASDDSKVYQLNSSTMALVNSYTTGSTIWYSSPAVSGGYVYVGSNDNKVYQLNASTMALVNSYTTGNDVMSSPVVVGGYIYVGSYDQKVYQLNASNMALVNSYTTGGSVHSSPAVYGGYVYVGSIDSKVYQLNASTMALVNSYTAADSIYSSPAVYGGYVYVGSNDNKVYQLNSSTMALVNSYTTGGSVYSSPAVANGYVYVGSNDNKTYQLNASTMALVNSYTTGNSIWYSSPAVSGGYVYVGSADNKVYQLNASNITIIVSNYTAGGWVVSSPAVSGGYVYVGSSDNKVYRFGGAGGSPIIYPNGGEFFTNYNETSLTGDLVNVTWSDAGDSYWYNLSYSNDSGATWHYLNYTNLTYFAWQLNNSFPEGTNYSLNLTLSNGTDVLSSDVSDAQFWIGNCNFTANDKNNEVIVCKNRQISQVGVAIAVGGTAPGTRLAFFNITYPGDLNTRLSLKGSSFSYLVNSTFGGYVSLVNDVASQNASFNSIKRAIFFSGYASGTSGYAVNISNSNITYPDIHVTASNSNNVLNNSDIYNCDFESSSNNVIDKTVNPSGGYCRFRDNSTNLIRNSTIYRFSVFSSLEGQNVSVQMRNGLTNSVVATGTSGYRVNVSNSTILVSKFYANANNTFNTINNSNISWFIVQTGSPVNSVYNTTFSGISGQQEIRGNSTNYFFNSSFSSNAAIDISDNAKLNFSNSTVYGFGAVGLSSGDHLTVSGIFNITNKTVVSWYGGALATRYFPVRVFNHTGNPVSGALVNVSNATSLLWSGYTDANGWAEPNVTFTNETYDDAYNITASWNPSVYYAFNFLENTPIILDDNFFSQAPFVNLSEPLNNTQFNNTNNVTLNFTAISILNTTLNCSLYINEAFNQSNSSTQNNTPTNFRVNVSLGNYTWRVSCNDGTLSNVSETRTFYVNDTLAPSLTIQYPVNNSNNITNPANISLNYIVSDAHLDSCWYTNISGQNVSLPGCNNTIFNASRGWNNITVYANDTSNNIVSKQIFFYVNQLPVAYLNWPLNNTQINNTLNVTLTFTVTDDAPPQSLVFYVCELTLNGVPQSPLIDSISNNTPTNYTVNVSPGNKYTWKVRCYDGYESNVWGDYSETWTFYVNDTIYPTLNVTSPVNGSNYTKNIINLSLTSSDLYLSRVYFIDVYGSEISLSEPSPPEEWPMFHYDPEKTGFTTNMAPSNVSQNILSNSPGLSGSLSPVVAGGYVYAGGNGFMQFNGSTLAIINQYSPGFGYVVESSPAVANGSVYFGTNKGVFHLNASNVSRYISNYSAGFDFFSCPGSPNVANGYVYIGCDKLYQLNASNVSRVIASYDLGGYINTYSAVANGYLYVRRGSYLLQLNASNVSRKIANYTIGDPIGWSSPAVANGYVYAVGSSKFYQLNASNISQLVATNDFTTVYSSPAVAYGYVYLGGSSSRGLYQFNASNISILVNNVSSTALNLLSSPAVANGYVYVGSRVGGQINQFDASTLSLINSYATGSDLTYSSPAIANGLGYIVSGSTLFKFGGIPSLNRTFIAKQGWNNITVAAVDRSNNTNSTQIFFFVDSIIPVLVINSPANNNVTNYSIVNFNWTVTDDNLVGCNLTIDGVVNASGLPVVSGVPYNYSVNLSEKKHNWSVTCWDILGNTNTSLTQNVSVDFNPPVVALNLPADNYQFNNTDTVNLNFTVTDTVSTRLNCSLYVNGILNQTNSSVVNGTITKFNVPVYLGKYNWSVNCSDGLWRNESVTRTFYVNDTLPPELYVYEPVNDSIYYSGPIDVPLTYDVYDDYGISECWFTNSTGQNVSLPDCQYTTFNSSFGANNITIYVNDTSNNIASETIFFYANIPPVIVLNYPSNNSQINNTNNVTLNFTVIDDTASSMSCQLYVNGSIKTTFAPVSNNTPKNYSLNVSLGKYNWSVSCWDSDLLGNSETWTFYVNDTINPYLNVTSPVNGSNYATTIIDLNWTASDAYLDRVYYVDVNGNSISLTEPSIPEEWPMFKYDLERTGFTTNMGPSNISRGALSYNTGVGAYSSPAVAGGYVYVGSYDNKVYQLNASTMALVNAFTTGGLVFSSPAVANGYVYVGSLDGKVYQLNASNVSRLINSYSTGVYIYSSPAVANGYVYVGGWDNKVYQLNASNISRLIASYTTGGEVTSSPAVANGYVYIGSRDNQVYQLNASNVSQKIANFTTGYVQSAPAVAYGYVYVGSYNNRTYQLNASNISRIVNSYDAGVPIQYEASPAVAYGYVYIGGTQNRTYQLNASNISRLVNTYNLLGSGNHVSRPFAVANGYLYLMPGYDSSLHQLDAYTLNLVNKYDFGYTDPFVSGPAVASGYVYVATEGKISRLGEVPNVNTTFVAKQGGNNITVTAEDTSNNTNSTQLFFFVDSINPSMVLNSPGNNNLTSSVVNFNWTATDDNLAGCNLTIDGTVNVSDLPVFSGVPYNYSVNLSNGRHNWSVACSDILGNSNTSVTWNFTVDTVEPGIVLNAPPAGIITGDTLIDFNWTVTDNIYANLYCNLTVDGLVNASDVVSLNDTPTNYTVSGFVDGIHHWNVTCWDGVNNTNISETWNFTVDTAEPLIVLNAPENGSFTNVNVVNFNWTVTDVQHTLLYCNLTVDGAVNASDVVSLNDTPTNYTVSGFVDGIHYWNVTCIDNVSNVNTSETWNFTVDTRPPVIFDIINTTTNETATINWSTNESANSTVEYGLTEGLGNSTSDGAFIITHSLLITGLENSTLYYYNITSCDAYGNCNTSGPFNFTTQSNNLPPSITSIGCTPNPTNIGGDVTCRANVVDDIGIGNVTANVTKPDSTIRIQNVACSGNNTSRSCSFTFTETQRTGTYNVFWLVNDTSGSSDTASSSFVIRSAAPPGEDGDGGRSVDLPGTIGSFVKKVSNITPPKEEVIPTVLKEPTPPEVKPSIEAPGKVEFRFPYWIILVLIAVIILPILIFLVKREKKKKKPKFIGHEKEVAEYIIKSRDASVNDLEIRSNLVNAKWDEKLVDTVFNKLK